MNNNEATLELSKHDGGITELSVIMPIWSKKVEDGSFLVNIPLLGLKTFATDESDIDIAVEEAIKCFCISASKFGNGVDAELKELGWKLDENQNDHILFNLTSDDNELLNNILQTGEQIAFNHLQFA